VFDDVETPYKARCFCTNAEVAEKYWGCYYRMVGVCANRKAVFDDIFGKLSRGNWERREVGITLLTQCR
jgi:hypothetical protein